MAGFDSAGEQGTKNLIFFLLWKDMEAFTIPFHSVSAKTLAEVLRTHGVCVVTGVLSPEFCKETHSEIKKAARKISPYLSRTDLETWHDPTRTPPQVRTGLYQGVYSNLQPVWDVRGHPNVHRVFGEAYTGLRGKPAFDLLTSVDGINLRPPSARRGHNPETEWPHLDQTERGYPSKCVQGQVVLTESSACFRCVPGSHAFHDEVLDLAGVKDGDRSNWCKFSREATPKIREFLESRGLEWAREIRAPPGSLVLWLSSTVHDARIQDPGDLSWRSVIYVCQRPKAECMPAHAKRLQRCIKENRATNHWGTRLFSKGPLFRERVKRRSKIARLVENPELVYDIVGRPRLTALMKRLTEK